MYAVSSDSDSYTALSHCAGGMEDIDLPDLGCHIASLTLPEAALHALVIRGSMARKRVVVADPRGVGMGGKGVAGCGANRQVPRDNAARTASCRHEQDTPTTQFATLSTRVACCSW